MEVKIELIKNPENSEALERMKNVCEYFMEQGRPKQFNPNAHDNVVIQHEKSFENILVSMQELNVQTDKLTVFEFYSKVEYFENKYAKLKKNGSQFK